MKRIFLSLFFCTALITSFSQTKPLTVELKLSAGRVSFGTGDFLGYSLSFDASKNIVKKPSFGLSKLLLGGELIFENGVKNPVVLNPTPDEFLQSFHHVSSTILWTKVSYYPFNKIINGFNIQVGPTVGYSSRSSESGAKLVVDALGQSRRQSTLAYDNGFIVGYRISTGFEIYITKKMLVGVRVDFSNNNEAEINTLAGLKVGIKI